MSLLPQSDGGDFEAQVRRHMRNIQEGRTPPFASSPAYREALRRSGMGEGSLAGWIAGLFGNKSNDPMNEGPIGSLGDLIKQQILGASNSTTKTMPSLDESPKSRGMVIGTEPHAYNNPMYPNLGYPYNTNLSPLGNPIVEPEDNSWKVKPLKRY